MSFLQDIRHALRLFARRPGLVFAAVLTLAIALGANTAVFGVVDAVLLRTLPYPGADRLVDLAVHFPPVEGRPAREGLLDGETLRAVDQSARSLAGLAVYERRALTVAGHGPTERVAGAGVSAALFDVLGVPVAEGRVFRPDEERTAGEPVVVLAHSLRRRRFADAEVVGARLVIGGVPHTVIGVMPAGFAFPDGDIGLWQPMAATQPEVGGLVQTQYLPAVGRLARDASVEAAAAEIQALVERRSAESPDAAEMAAGRVQVVPLRERQVAEVRPALLAMWAAVALVLVVACANLASLLLAHAASRRRELAIRSAIGGGPRRLVRQLLTENALLALVGGVSGLLLAAAVHRSLPRWAPADVPGLERAAFDLRVFAFAAVLAAATACFFGLLPAWQSARADLVQPLHGAVGEVPRDRRSRGALVVAEVALSLVLLVGAGLLVRGFLHLVRVDLGFRPGGAVVAAVDPAAAGIAASGRRTALYDALLARFAADGAVEAAGGVAYPPLTPGFTKTGVGVVGQPPARRLAVPQWTSPGYAEAVGLRVVAGRWLSEREHREAAPVVVVGESFARQFFAGLDPLRQRLEIGGATLQVIGVVGDVRLLGFGSEPQAEVYASYRLAEAATGAAPGRLTIVVRTASPPSAVAGAMRSRLAQIEPGVAAEDLGRLEDRLAASVARPRFYAALAATFAAVALLLAAVGLYGVVASSVAAQRRAFGVRRVLGAEQRDILRLVLARGALLVVGGLALGILASWWTTRSLAVLLSGLPAADPTSYLAATGVVGAVALTACYLPARRASRVDPLIVLRSE